MMPSSLEEKAEKARHLLEELSARLSAHPDLSQARIAEGLDGFSAFLEETLRGETQPASTAPQTGPLTASLDETRQALREARDLELEKIAELETFLDAVPALVWISRDRECREMTGSRYGYEFLGMWKGANLSKSAYEQDLNLQRYRNFKDGQEIPAGELPMQVAARTGQRFMDYEFDIQFEDGSVHNLLGNVFPLLDREGQPRGAVGAFIDITDRKRMETEQRRRETVERQRAAELQAIIDAVPTPMFIARDPLGEVIIGNKATYQMINLPPGANISRLATGNLPGAMSSSLHEEQEIPTEEAPIYKVLRTGQRIENYEARLLFTDGRDVTLLGNASPILDQEGNISGGVSVFMDITSRKDAEHTLKQNAERDAYRIQLADAIRRLDNPEQIKATAARFLGEKIGASRVFYASISEDAEEVNIEPGYAKGIDPLAGHFRFADFQRDLERDHPEGRPFILKNALTDPRLSEAQRAAYLAVNVKAHVDVPMVVHGKFVALFSANQNEPREWTHEEVSLIVETAERTWASVARAQAEKALRESEKRFRESIESLMEGFIYYTAIRELREDGAPGRIIDLHIEYANAAAHRINRRERGEMEGQTLLSVFPNEFGRHLFDRYIRVIGTGEPLMERALLGETPEMMRVYDIHAVPLGDGLVVTRLDVTEAVNLGRERQNAITQMEIQRRLAEHSEKERQSYARELHDGPIQTLASIAYQLQFLKESFSTPGLSEEVERVDTSLRTAIQELRQVINDLRPPAALRYGLVKAIQQHAEDIEERQTGIEWEFNLPAEETDLPASFTLALYRIYQESVHNIIRHSGATRAQVCYFYEGNQIVLEVEDDGKGMPEEQDYDQLTRNGHYGLAGIRERVESINGTLQIATQPGKGTCIRVTATLPA